MVREVGLEIVARIKVVMPMPYQSEDSNALWCNVDHNLEMARLNVVAAVHSRHPDYSVEKLATLMGRGASWLYALLGRHKEVEWVRSVMAIR